MMSEETEKTGAETAGDTDKAPVKKAAPRKRAAAPKKAATPRKTAAKKPAAAKKASSSGGSRKAAPKKAAAKTAVSKATDTAAKASAEVETKPETPATEPQPQQMAGQAEGEPENKHAAGGEQDFDTAAERDWSKDVKRGAFMLLFGVLGWIAISTAFTLAAVQFVLLLITGKHNDVLQSVMVVLGRYIGEVMNYLSFKSDDMPFPFGNDLPTSD